MINVSFLCGFLRNWFSTFVTTLHNNVYSTKSPLFIFLGSSGRGSFQLINTLFLFINSACHGSCIFDDIYDVYKHGSEPVVCYSKMAFLPIPFVCSELHGPRMQNTAYETIVCRRVDLISIISNMYLSHAVWGVK